MTVRRCRIFRAGSYPEQQFSITPEELAHTAATFNGPIPLSIEFEQTGEQYGNLISVEAVGDELYGVVDVPDWLLKQMPHNASLGAQFERNAKTLLGLAFTKQPVIEDAQLLDKGDHGNA